MIPDSPKMLLHDNYTVVISSSGIYYIDNAGNITPNYEQKWIRYNNCTVSERTMHRRER